MSDLYAYDLEKASEQIRQHNEALVMLCQSHGMTGQLPMQELDAELTRLRAAEAAGMRRAVEMVKLQAAGIRAEEDSYLQWGGPDPRGQHARQMRLDAAKSLDTLALTILAAIPAPASVIDWKARAERAEALLAEAEAAGVRRAAAMIAAASDRHAEAARTIALEGKDGDRIARGLASYVAQMMRIEHDAILAAIPASAPSDAMTGHILVDSPELEQAVSRGIEHSRTAVGHHMTADQHLELRVRYGLSAAIRHLRQAAPAPWTPPDDRPDGYRCLGKCELGWEEIVWDGEIWRDTCGAPIGADIARFWPLPPSPEARP